nr:MAG TPA: hypothetical protein [Caudoviricetes sp.]
MPKAYGTSSFSPTAIRVPVCRISWRVLTAVSSVSSSKAQTASRRRCSSTTAGRLRRAAV